MTSCHKHGRNRRDEQELDDPGLGESDVALEPRQDTGAGPLEVELSDPPPVQHARDASPRRLPVPSSPERAYNPIYLAFSDSMTDRRDAGSPRVEPAAEDDPAWSTGGERQMSSASVRSSSAAAIALVWSAALTGGCQRSEGAFSRPTRDERRRAPTFRIQATCRRTASTLMPCGSAGSRAGHSCFIIEFFLLASACLVAGWWQVTRALTGNGLSWVYSAEWPGFAVLAILRLVASHSRGSRGLSSPEATAPRMGRRLRDYERGDRSVPGESILPLSS